MSTNDTQAPSAGTKTKGDQQPNATQDKGGDKAARHISEPRDVASLVLMQVDAVNTKKDDLTIVIKGLVDTTKQLVNAYAKQTQTIKKLQEKVKELEVGRRGDHPA